jgi:glycosyltransferase involved in cell wall biosynthesis
MTSVVHVGPDCSGASVGGMASVIRTLVDTAPYPAVAVASWSAKGWHPHARRLVRALAEVVRSPRNSVVHVHMSEGGSWVREAAFALVARLSGKRVALTLHGAELGRWVSGRIARWWVGSVLRLADVAFALQDADAALVREVSSTPVRIICNPVAAVDVPAAGIVTTRAATVVFVGEQSHRKGVDVLAEAWPGVLASHPEARLLIAGPPRDGAPLAGPGVSNLGRVSPDRARRLVREATVVVLPSRAEALPMVLLEAMAEGVPFVASAVAGIPRLAAAGAGLLVRPGDAAELTAAIARVLADPQLRTAMGRAGRAWWEVHSAPRAVHDALQSGYRLVGHMSHGP